MASIQQDPSGNFHVTFPYGGQRFKRSLRTKLKRKAEAAASQVEKDIRLIHDASTEKSESPPSLRPARVQQKCLGRCFRGSLGPVVNQQLRQKLTQ